MKYSLFIALSLGSLQHHQYPLHWTRNDQAIISFLVPQFLSHIQWVLRSLASLQSIRLAPAVTGWQYSATHHPARVVLGWGMGMRMRTRTSGVILYWKVLSWVTANRRFCSISSQFSQNVSSSCPPDGAGGGTIGLLVFWGLMSFPGWKKIGAASLAYLIGIINWTFNPWIWFSPDLWGHPDSMMAW